MTRPEDLFEAASYDLNKFRERRVAERRLMPRDSADRRQASSATTPLAQPPYPDGDSTGKSD